MTEMTEANTTKGYASRSYWRQRSDMLYYRYIDWIIRATGAQAESLIDVGSGNCPYLDWFDWIGDRVSVDIRVPYAGPGIRPIKGDILTLDFPKRFDSCTCLQVLEHVPDVEPFARRLLAPGSYAARNAGAAAAQSDWLLFTDADCLPQPGWIAAYRRAMAERTSRLLAGPIEMLSGPRPGFVESYDCVRGIPQERFVARGYAVTANLAVEAALFRKLGGFDAKRYSGGDAEFSRRAAAAGSPVVLVPEARVVHPCRTEWAEVLGKARRLRGGQILHGRPRRRIAWVLRGVLPPLDEALRLGTARVPLAMRARALAVLWVVWAVGIAEMVRLGLGGQPERR